MSDWRLPGALQGTTDVPHVRVYRCQAIMGAKDRLRTEAEHCEMSISGKGITEDGRCYQMPVQQIGKLTMPVTGRVLECESPARASPKTPARVAPKSPHGGCQRLRPGVHG